MQDRFKFRLWAKDIEIYFKGALIYINTDGKLVAEDGVKVYEIDQKAYIVEQCTGLKDKNGKLIYEGDWLKTKDGYYCYVVWFDGFWWVKSLPSEAMDFEHSGFYEECEVVGNIHENKELLDD